MGSESDKCTVIVVEDEPEMQIFLSTLLSEHGFEPIVASNEVEGLEKARRLNPACIILNAMIPMDGGIAMYVQLKCDRTLKTVPVIMLSPIARKLLYHFRTAPVRPDGDIIPEPEAFFENPPDGEELLKEVHKLARRQKRS